MWIRNKYAYRIDATIGSLWKLFYIKIKFIPVFWLAGKIKIAFPRNDVFYLIFLLLRTIRLALPLSR